MFYKEPLKLKNSKTIKFKIDNFLQPANCDTDENSLPMNVAKMSYNFRRTNGALKSGYGVEELKLLDSEGSSSEHTLTFVSAPTKINKVWLYPYFNTLTKEKDNILLISADDKLYFCELVSQAPMIYQALNDVSFTSIPNAIYYNLNGEDVMLVTSETDGMLVYHPQNVNSLLSNAPKIISMCKHYNRIFAIESGNRNKLVYSDNLDPTGWVESDTKYFNLADDKGALIKVVNFNDFVYIFKEFGISKLSAYSSQEDFAITDLFAASGKIYSNSICLCGDKIMFLAKDGLYSFNGYSSTKISTQIESLLENIDNENCSCAFYNGKYYLATRINFGDEEKIGCENYSGGYVNNALLEYDMKSGAIEIVRGLDIKSMCAIEYDVTNKLVFAFNGEHKNKLAQLSRNGKYFSSSLKKYWISAFTNLGQASKPKKIKTINLIANGPCKVIVRTDKFKKEYDVNGASKTTKILPNIEGEMFQIGFESESPAVQISNAEIEVSVTD